VPQVRFLLGAPVFLIMKCYKHENIDAVATCRDCGRGLCSQCANKYFIPLCDYCFLNRANRDYNFYKKAIVIDLAYFIVLVISTIFVMKTYYLPHASNLFMEYTLDNDSKELVNRLFNVELKNPIYLSYIVILGFYWWKYLFKRISWRIFLYAHVIEKVFYGAIIFGSYLIMAIFSPIFFIVMVIILTFKIIKDKNNIERLNNMIFNIKSQI